MIILGLMLAFAVLAIVANVVDGEMRRREVPTFATSAPQQARRASRTARPAAPMFRLPAPPPNALAPSVDLGTMFGIDIDVRP